MTNCESQTYKNDQPLNLKMEFKTSHKDDKDILFYFRKPLHRISMANA